MKFEEKTEEIEKPTTEPKPNLTEDYEQRVQEELLSVMNPSKSEE